MSDSVSRRYPSPLRYPGGKGKIANYIKLLILANGLVGCEYVEPYAGGASVALSLLFEEYASHIHINDLNRSVYTFWKVVLEDPDALCRRISKTRVTVEEWVRQRGVQAAGSADDVDLACSTFFLNRTSRSGIITGGIIGGHDQTGPWKIDARYNRKALIRRIEKIGRFRTRITVTGIDTAEYLKTVLPNIDGAFVYLDPPYYVKGSWLYENYYRHSDHEEIARVVGQLQVPWVVSYDAVPEVESLYAGFDSVRYRLSYSAGGRQSGAEQMFFSPGLRSPAADSPANIRIAQVDRVHRDRFSREPQPNVTAG